MLIRITTLAATLALGFAATAPAVVPPRDCGTLRVSGRSYNIKADQLRCSTAKKYATAYLAHHTRPKGFSCRRNKNSALVAKCVNTHTNPDRTIFIIKR